MSKLVQDKNQQDFQSISQSAELFSWELLKTLAEYNQGNLIISPLSVSIALAMTTYGACEKTAEEMKKVLHLSEKDSADHQKYFQTLIQELKNDKTVTLKLATKIFLAKDLVIKKPYQQLTEKMFHSTCEQLDFKNPVEVAEEINKFCQVNTNGRVKEIITPDEIVPLAKMVLVNALYFKGSWKEMFQPEYTRDCPFHVDNHTTVQVPTMRRIDLYLHGNVDELEANFVIIPYQDSQFSMIFFIPNDINGLPKLLSKLPGIKMADIEKKTSCNYVDINIPKFRIDSPIPLMKPLKKLGMIDAFAEEDADFSDISDLKPLWINSVLQIATIEVNEAGTEAAAFGRLSYTGGGSSVPIINVDRPFAFIIMHGKSRLSLFSGYVKLPSV